MTDSTHPAEIVVGVDATPAQQGLQQLERQAASTARTVDRIGGGPGLQRAGATAATASNTISREIRNIQSAVERQIAVMQAGTRGTSQYFEALGRLRGIPADALRPLVDLLREVEAGMTRTGVSAGQTAQALRTLPAQMTDVVTSLQGGQSALTVMLQQGGQIRDQFGSIGGAVRGLGSFLGGLVTPFTIAAAAAAGLFAAIRAGASEAESFNKSIALSGNAAGVTTRQLSDMAISIAAVQGSQHGAAAALNEFAASGKIAGDNIQRFSALALDMERIVGRSVKDTLAEFESVADKPIEGLERLQQKYHNISIATYEQVRALKDQGRAAEAASLAQNAYADAIEKQKTKVLATLSDWERGWIRLKKIGADTVNAALDFATGSGRETADSEKINSLLKQRDVLERSLAASQRAGQTWNLDSLQKQLDKNKLSINSIRDRADAEKRAAQAEAEAGKAKSARMEFDQIADQYKERAAKKSEAIDKATQLNKLAAFTDEGERKRALGIVLAGIEKDYSDVVNKQVDARIEAMKRELAVKDMLARTAQGQISVKVAKREITQEQAIDESAVIDIKNLAAHRAALVAERAEIAKKADALKDLAAIQGQISAVDAQSAVRESERAKSQALRIAENVNLIKDQVAANQLDAEFTQRNLGIEISMYGRTAEARAAALLQARAEIGIEKLIQDKIREGNPLSEEQIALLRKKTDAHTKLTNALQAQLQELGYAHQLDQENKRFATEYIIDEKAKARAVLAIDDEMWRERIQMAGDGTEAQKQLQQAYSTWYENQLTKPQLEAQKRLWDSVESTAHDTFISIFDSGKSAFDRLRDTLKNGLLDLLYQMTVKKWIFNIGASISGSGGDTGSLTSFASAGGSGGGMNAASLISMGKTIYSGFSSGLGSGVGGMVSSVGNMFGSANVSAFGTGMGLSSSQAATAASAYNSAGMAGTGSALSSGSSFGSAASTAGWIALGMTLSNNMFKKGWDPNNGSLQKTAYLQPLMVGESLAWNKLFRGLGMGDQAASIFSGASLTSRLFGRKNPEVTEQGVSGTFGADGFAGNGYANVLEKGGLFRSDKRYTKTAALDAGTDEFFDSTIKNLMASVKGFGEVLGLPVAQIDDYTKAIKLTLTDDEAKNKEAIAKLFGGIGEDLSTLLVPTIAQFSKAATEFGGAGETASATLQRVVTEYTVIDAALQSIGSRFGAVGFESVAARERLLDLSGGLENFGKSAAFFAQNYLTEAERLAPVAKSVEAALSTLGLSGIATRDQFKDMVLGLDLTTEAGSKTYAGLMKIEEAFAQLHPSIDASTEALKSQRQELQDQLDELTLAPDQLVAKQRAKVDPSNAGLFDQVQAAAAAKALVDLNRTYLDQVDAINKAQLTGAALRAAEIKGMDASTVALYDRLDALKQETKASKLAADAVIASVKAKSDLFQSFGDSFIKTMDAAKEAAKSLRDFNDSLLLGNLSPLDTEARYREAKRQFSESNGTDSSIVSAFLQASKDRDAENFYYQRDFAAAQEKLLAGAAAKDESAASIPDAWKATQEALERIFSHLPGATSPAMKGVLGPAAGFYQGGTSASVDTRSMGAAIETMSEKLEKVLSTVATNTAKTADVLSSVTDGGNALVTTAL